MLNFDTSLFAIAGLFAAAGPIIIHLLNRRRFRPIQWAAMDFLRQALERNKRILHLRDLILLALRVLAVILFGLTLARPYYRGSAFGAIWHGGWVALGVLGLFGAAIWGVIAADNNAKRAVAGGIAALAALVTFWSGAGLLASRAEDITVAGSRHQPVHAILLIDNSRSLGAELVGTTLLDQAKTKAKEFLAALPADSRMTVIPIAGSEDAFTLDAYRHREETEKAIDRLTAADTAGNLRLGLELAAQAGRQVTELPTKRVVLLTDMQRSEFRDADWGSLVEPLGGLQISPVSAESPRNVWLSDFHLEDGLASVEAPCRFLALIESSGEGPASVLVRLSIDGNEVSSQTVEVSPGQTREVAFTYQLEGGSDPERASFSLAELSLQTDTPSGDRLPADNRRVLVIPVVAALPVVFIDEHGNEENFEKNLFGETYALRHLLAPKTAGDLDQRRLIRVIHTRQDQVSEELLRTARLVVMAGVERPDACVFLLRDFVQQGGPLLILAGGAFNPSAWQEHAWLDGRGILPAPLKPESHGVTPDEAPERIKPFFADFKSMQHDFFQVEQEDPELLAEIFNKTPFFKAVQADVGPTVLADLLAAESKRLTAEQAFLTEFAEHRKSAADRGASNSPSELASREDEERRYRQIEPAWWMWRSPLPLLDRTRSPADLAERQQPHILAEYQGLSLPFVVDRQVGAGRIVLVTSGATSNWNLVRGSAAMYMFHRMISSLIKDTLPARNYEAGQRVTLPVDRVADVRYQLTRPSGRQETLPVEALTADVSGVQIRSVIQSGAYRILAEQVQAVASSASEARPKLDEWTFAVNGPVSESDLSRISPEELSTAVGRDDVRILGVNETIDLAGGARRGQGLWQGCLFGALLALLAEMLLLGWPMLGRKEAA